MADFEHEKRLAAAAGVQHVRDGMLLGLGSGSTAEYAIRLLGQRVRSGLCVRGIPTSRRSEALAREEGIPLATFDEAEEIDLTLDGADEIGPGLSLIKGGGGALLHEKIVAAASRRVMILAESRKLVPALGAFPLPVEVIPFGWQVAARRIRELGAAPVLRLDLHGDPFITDEGNHILDCPFGRIPEPETLAAALHAIPGVVEHGLFLGLAGLALIGRGDEVATVDR